MFTGGPKFWLTYCVPLTAGSGKTILAAGIIGHIFSLGRTNSSISYFFCDFNDRKSRQTRTILSSLARQILNVFEETPEIGEKLKSMFLTNHMEPDVNELSEFLLCLSQLPNTAYLLIDGLDECDDSDRREILSFLKKVVRDGQCRIKVIISSRWDLDISNALQDFHRISLGSSGTCSDIGVFIRDIIDQRLADGSIEIKEPSMAEEIKEALIQKSDGMYVL